MNGRIGLDYKSISLDLSTTAKIFLWNSFHFKEGLVTTKSKLTKTYEESFAISKKFLVTTKEGLATTMKRLATVK